MKIIRSRRRSIGLEIRAGELIVRAPLWVSEREIRRVLEERRDWIEKHLKKAEEEQKRMDAAEPLSAAELRALARQAKAYIPQRVAHYAPLVGVSYGRIFIRNQKTLWGSCSSRGNLNFNCLLMLTPPEVIDSVVVHELCHRKHMDHSQRFYTEVLRVYPEYRRWHRWLKENGKLLMARARKGNADAGAGAGTAEDWEF